MKWILIIIVSNIFTFSGTTWADEKVLDRAEGVSLAESEASKTTTARHVETENSAKNERNSNNKETSLQKLGQIPTLPILTSIIDGSNKNINLEGLLELIELVQVGEKAELAELEKNLLIEIYREVAGVQKDQLQRELNKNDYGDLRKQQPIDFSMDTIKKKAGEFSRRKIVGWTLAAVLYHPATQHLGRLLNESFGNVGTQAHFLSNLVTMTPLLILAGFVAVKVSIFLWGVGTTVKRSLSLRQAIKFIDGTIEKVTSTNKIEHRKTLNKMVADIKNHLNSISGLRCRMATM